MRRAIQELWRWLGRGRRDDSAAAADGRWIVVDTETSGLDPRQDRLLAIGGVAVDDVGIVLDDSFEIVVQGESSGDAANIVVHGIGHAAQRAGMPPNAALAAFDSWSAGAPRVGFHTEFDRAVLGNAFARAGIAMDAGAWLDLDFLAGALLSDEKRRGQRGHDEWLATFGIECASRHNAASDALATAELLLRLRAIAAAQGVRGFDALVKTASQQKWLGRA